MAAVTAQGTISDDAALMDQNLILRAAGRKLDFWGLAIDGFMWLYGITAFITCLFAYSLAFWQLGHSWTWDFVRLFTPALLGIFLILGLYVLVFYKRFFLLLVFLGMLAVIWLYQVFCLGWTGIADWASGHCKDTLWCANIHTFDDVGGLIVLGPRDNSNARLEFKCYFFFLLAMILEEPVIGALAFFVHYVYINRNIALNVNNRGRYVSLQSDMNNNREEAQPLLIAESEQQFTPHSGPTGYYMPHQQHTIQQIQNTYIANAPSHHPPSFGADPYKTA